MIKELFFLKEPFLFKKGISIHPPTVKEVISEKNFNLYVQVLTYSQEDVEDDFIEEKYKMDKYPTPFEYLLNNSYHSEQYQHIVEDAFQFFTKKKANLLYDAKVIILGDLEEVLKEVESLQDLIILEEKDFFDFQNIIRESIGYKTVEPPNPNEHPKIKEMKRKARYRDKIKAKQKGKEGISLYTMLVSICCMGLGITPLNIGEISFVAAGDIMNRYQDKEKYKLDIETILAGGDAKKINPKYWIRNLEE